MNPFRAIFEKVGPHVFAVALLVFCILSSAVALPAQTLKANDTEPSTFIKAGYGEGGIEGDEKADFRIEKVKVAGGAEILTIFARTDGPPGKENPEMPMVSILRDTLGDEKSENDQLRYVWMLTYTKPTLGQKMAAFVPFLYTRTTNKTDAGSGPPPAVADIRRSDKAVWNMVVWTVIKKLVLTQAGMMGPRTSILQYQQNTSDYRRSAIARALSILSLYQTVNGEQLLTETEMKDIQARLWLTDKPFGWHMQDENLSRVYDKELAGTRDVRGHNWELLRQYSERQGLYFEPLEMPDGTARHAIVWTSAEDLRANRGRKFESRFLNIKNPWTDQKLANWTGYSQDRYFDADDRIVDSGTNGARAKRMIPLAIYGLDNPKIPAILVDFRDNGNPKRREMSRRILTDVTGNVLAIGQFSSLPYFLSRFVYDFATGRRGADINQASRVRSYAQLKTLLSLDASLDDAFRHEIEGRLEKVSLNPLENDLGAEVKLARQQYANLMEYAKRPDGLPAQLDRERREEMVKFAHSGKQRVMYTIGHILSLGMYTHREKTTPELYAAMDTRRQLAFHERYLREVAAASAKPEVDADVAALKRSLLFISQNGAGAKAKTTRALATIFAITGDDEMRSLCVTGLYRVNNSSAKKQLLAIYDNSKVDDRWRSMSARYLKQALIEGQQMSVRDAETVAGITTN